ncbi:MAG: TRAM domain-containing protein, partial [Bacteroidota bacterium]
GNTRVLKLMNRTYSREWYINKVNRIYEIMPDCAISSDVIAGFCTETEEEHQETLSMLSFANYSMSYMFYYSERPGTLAARKYEDDIPLATKKRRLQEIIRLQNQISHRHNQADVGKVFKVLIEGDSKKSDQDFKGRNTQNKMLVFPKKEGLKAGDYTYVKVESATSATLKGKIVEPPKNNRSDWPVNFVKKGEDDSNLKYWLTQSPQERMTELEKTRQEVNKRLYGDRQEFQRVYRIVERS